MIWFISPEGTVVTGSRTTSEILVGFFERYVVLRRQTYSDAFFNIVNYSLDLAKMKMTDEKASKMFAEHVEGTFGCC